MSQRQSVPADELSGVVDELLSLQVSQRQSAPVDELSGVVDERRCCRLTQPTAQSNSSLSRLPPKMVGAKVNVTSDVIRITSIRLRILREPVGTFEPRSVTRRSWGRRLTRGEGRSKFSYVV